MRSEPCSLVLITLPLVLEAVVCLSWTRLQGLLSE